MATNQSTLPTFRCLIKGCHWACLRGTTVAAEAVLLLLRRHQLMVAILHCPHPHLAVVHFLMILRQALQRSRGQLMSVQLQVLLEIHGHLEASQISRLSCREALAT